MPQPLNPFSCVRPARPLWFPTEQQAAAWRSLPKIGRLLTLLALCCCAPISARGAEPAARPKVDFGRDIQPILAKRCFPCHGPDQSKSGLRLDKRESALAEAASGEHAVVPGKIDDSELLRRIASTDKSERMPPEGAPLSASQIELLRQWITEGAPFEEHWAFRPVAPQSIPMVQDRAWVATPIDAFVLQRLEEKGLKPAPAAEKLALLRRATYDVTGLPPTPADVDAFLADTAPDAYERLVDRLLASPHYGERWGRHWLDVVRFAETNSFERDGKKPHAWRYRDYVIRAFNNDKPYDRFIREQLAGDEMPDRNHESLTATGFYRLGLWDDEPADRELARFDMLDDIVATTGQVFLGLTLNCARCHDHKIDPIPQRDYYSMVAFFHGVTGMTNDGPNIEAPLFVNETARQAYQAKVAELNDRRNQAQAEVTAIEKEFREKYEAATNRSAGEPPDLDDLEFRFYRDDWTRLPDFDNLKAETVGKLPDQRFDLAPATRDSAFGFVYTGVLKVPADGEYAFTLDADDGARLIVDGKRVINYDGQHEVGEPQHAKAVLKAGRIPIRLEYFQKAQRSGLKVGWSGPGFERRWLSAAGKQPNNFNDVIRADGINVLGLERFRMFQERQRKLDELRREKVPADFALVVTEQGPQSPDTFVMRRGNPRSPGEKVTPAFPKLFDAAAPDLPAPQRDARTSGRRSVVADWIADPNNRLTARVMANRIWQHHFGRGIVRSPNNFGLLGDRPTHPELLDWLAAEFVKGGWRLKPLHRLVLLSNTYRMSSHLSEAASAAARERDPANDLFTRFDMRRLSAEELRDSIHAANGRLNPQMFGPGYYPEISAEVLAGQSAPGNGWGKSSADEQARRSVYIHLKRSLITPLLADFDFADTDSSCAARFATTQPAQALGMLNGDFARGQAAEFAKRLRREAGAEPAAQVKLALRLALSRDPDRPAVDRGVALLTSLQQKHGIDADTALTWYCLVVLNLNEFVYLD